MKPSVSRLGTALATLVLYGSLAGAAPTERLPQSLAPADANLLARVDVGDIQRSGLIELLRGSYRRELTVAETLMAVIVGFVPQDVTRIWLFAPQPRNGVALLEGEFEADQVAGKLARLNALQTLDVPGVRHASRMIEERDGRVVVLAVLSDRLLALGDEAAMKGLFATWRGDLEGLPRNDPALQEVAGAKGHMSATLREPTDWPELDPKAATLIEQTSLRAQFTEDLQIEIDLQAVDALAARALGDIVSGWLLIERRDLDRRGEPALAELLESAQLVRNGDRLRFSLELAGTDIVKGLEGRAVSKRSQQSSPAGPLPDGP